MQKKRRWLAGIYFLYIFFVSIFLTASLHPGQLPFDGSIYCDGLMFEIFSATDAATSAGISPGYTLKSREQSLSALIAFNLPPLTADVRRLCELRALMCAAKRNVSVVSERSEAPAVEMGADREGFE
jgi:hypothetical protein